MSILSFGLCISACQTEEQTSSPADDLALSWELVKNHADGKDEFLARFILTNQGKKEWPATGWSIYFNQTNRRIVPGSVTGGAELEQISGDFYRLFPTDDFQPLAPGQSVQVEYKGSAWMIKYNEAPAGIYLVMQDEQDNETAPQILKNVEIRPFNRGEQISRGPADRTPIPTPDWVFQQNETRLPPAVDVSPGIIPTPRKWIQEEGTFTLPAAYTLQNPAELQSEAAYLQEHLSKLFGKPGGEKKEGAPLIRLALEPGTAESYRLSVDSLQGISIVGADAAGVFYGIQSLLALLPPASYRQPQATLSWPAIHLVDGPRFSYRGLHLDVARNFHSKEAVLKLLDLMATYKMNKFHFHLTDDEGWRLEIPELPELTQVGAFRGHTLDEKNHLHPAYGSGPFPTAGASGGSGYYSATDFVEILRYAKSRHIEVIPEIDMPGHARAAIKSMQARYTRLQAEGKTAEAEAYLLHDPADQSEYRSVQDFDDNVICVCRESTYRFLETVVDRLAAYFKEADAPWRMVHIGGDEVPGGVWTKSPLCADLIASNSALAGPGDLPAYFIDRFDRILDKHGLLTAGWEEIALQRGKPGSGHAYESNPAFLDRNLVPYVWNNLGEQIDLGNRLANAGYPVVLCHVTNLYFDLAYNKDPAEPGFYWGGFVDTRKAFEFVPEDVFKSTYEDNMGRPLDTEAMYRERVGLQKPENILGLQGQLWSETLINPERLEYYVAPKLLGLAERAWAAPSGAGKASDNLDSAWSRFARKLGERELPRLDYLHGGFGYRIPWPGARILDGVLYANVAFPGMQIRYTTDGSEPTMNSTLYQEPVKVSGSVRLRTFTTNGRGSRLVEVGEIKN